MKTNIQIMKDHIRNGRFLDMALKFQALGATTAEMTHAVERVRDGECIIAIIADKGLAPNNRKYLD